MTIVTLVIRAQKRNLYKENQLRGMTMTTRWTFASVPALASALLLLAVYFSPNLASAQTVTYPAPGTAANSPVNPQISTTLSQDIETTSCVNSAQNGASTSSATDLIYVLTPFSVQGTYLNTGAIPWANYLLPASLQESNALVVVNGVSQASGVAFAPTPISGGPDPNIGLISDTPTYTASVSGVTLNEKWVGTYNSSYQGADLNSQNFTYTYTSSYVITTGVQTYTYQWQGVQTESGNPYAQGCVSTTTINQQGTGTVNWMGTPTPVLSINTSLPAGQAGVAYPPTNTSAPLVVGGQPPYNISAKLPPGLTVDKSGLVSGTPLLTDGGAYSVPVTVSDSAGMSLNGTSAVYINPAAVSAFSVAPSTLSFGSVPYGQPAPLSVTVTNTGSGACDQTSQVSLTGLTPPTAPFSVTPSGFKKICPGDSAGFTVTFNPSPDPSDPNGDNPKPFSATLGLLNSVAAIPQSLQLYGTGVPMQSWALTLLPSTGTAETMKVPYAVQLTATNNAPGPRVLHLTTSLDSTLEDSFTSWPLQYCDSNDPAGAGCTAQLVNACTLFQPGGAATFSPTVGAGKSVSFSCSAEQYWNWLRKPTVKDLVVNQFKDSAADLLQVVTGIKQIGSLLKGTLKYSDALKAVTDLGGSNDTYRYTASVDQSGLAVATTPMSATTSVSLSPSAAQEGFGVQSFVASQAASALLGYAVEACVATPLTGGAVSPACVALTGGAVLGYDASLAYYNAAIDPRYDIQVLSVPVPVPQSWAAGLNPNSREGQLLATAADLSALTTAAELAYARYLGALELKRADASQMQMGLLLEFASEAQLDLTDQERLAAKVVQGLPALTSVGAAKITAALRGGTLPHPLSDAFSANGVALSDQAEIASSLAAAVPQLGALTALMPAALSDAALVNELTAQSAHQEAQASGPTVHAHFEPRRICPRMRYVEADIHVKGVSAGELVADSIRLNFTVAPSSVEVRDERRDREVSVRARFDLYASDFPKLKAGRNLLALSGQWNSQGQTFGTVAALTLTSQDSNTADREECQHFLW